VIKSVDGYHKIVMDGAWSYGEPGEPVLPMMGARILLPPGEVITDVTVIPGEKIFVGGDFLLEPGQMQYPLSYDGPLETVMPDYASTPAFPGRLHDDPVVGRYRGYVVANIALHPVEYRPAAGAVSYYTSMDVEITTAPSTEELSATERMIRHDDATIAAVAGKVDNAAARNEYLSVERVRTSSRSLDPGLEYKYIIITTDSWDDYLGDLVAFQTQRGLKAGVFLRDWIQTNYTGIDDPQKIRNFVIDAYNTWDIDYVLLVGDARDDNGIPHRGLRATAYGDTDSDIPADLYYSSLDGSWNTDGDQYWGEQGEEDWYGEVGIGRCCNSTAAQVMNFVTKTLRYQDEPVVDESGEALMVGELLWTSPLTYGGDYKDEVKNGSSANGYSTIVS